MIGALWTGISGLASQQTALDNESNNIANVNTIGYKASRISFADQMYQDRIGKGSKILDAEKLYTQGNLKLTGVNYDMALSGDGFFTVVNKTSAGTSESLYTRAGNFRMGDNGTLQDSAGNEVQGWMMTSIDTENDVTSTNPNADVFTDDYTKLLGSKVIRHGTYVETITAKATDYSATAASDSTSVFSGDGAKTKSSKESDIEAAIKDYTSWLQKLKDEPDASSATSIAQTSQINFKSGPESIISKDGDQIYVYIDGNKYSQNFILTSASAEFKQELWNDLSSEQRTSEGLINPENLSIPPLADQKALDAANAAYDKAAGKIATYRGLADKISQISGLVATTAIDSGKIDAFNQTETYKSSTNYADTLKGIIQIKSLIPGTEFTISEVAEGSGNTIVQGNSQSTTLASKGSGIGALETSKDALAKLISGKQQDVYTINDLSVGTSAGNYLYGITIYDKELKINTPIPNDGANPPQSVPVMIENGTSIDKIVEQINANPDLSQYVVARNVNNNLVVETLDSNFDVEFAGNIKQLPSIRIDLNEMVDQAEYTINLTVDGKATTLTFDSDVDLLSDELTKKQFYDDIKSKIETYNADPTNANKIIITSLNSDGNFSIYSEDESVSFEGSTISIANDVQPTVTVPVIVPNTNTVLEEALITLPTDGVSRTYSFDIFGETVSYTSSASESLASIHAGIENVISSNSLFDGLIEIKPLSGNTFSIEQIALKDINTPAAMGSATAVSASPAPVLPQAFTIVDTATFDAGTAGSYTFTPTLADTDSSSVFTFSFGDTTLKVQTDQTPTAAELNNLLNEELSKNPALSEKITITEAAGVLTVTEKITSEGFMGIDAPTVAFSSLTEDGDEFKTTTISVNNVIPIDVNGNFSGRKGAGAEFIEIVNKVDQTASKGSLQLRLDTLGISDSAFGEFSVDSTGLITMTQDGAEFAVGQVAIALFNNNRGLNPVGDNLLAKTNESGDPVYNLNNNKTAKIESQTLELSTADLSESLVNLMVFQRAFEANAKSITTSDELLSTLINLKR